ncbi:T9SS type A sorting domain-containing protein [Segetibacter koreensis]|uniref:T9SS type A sorting domain-containing protein n=1 Tax=Segetibacter koreensis TaxID=398037 RepID=UPI00037407EF|nr:T9SS type A sorting domain-containing protein [Segetibacter koreensis]
MKRNRLFLKQKFTLVLTCIILISTFASAQWIEKTKAFKARSEVAGVVYDSKVYTFLGFGNSRLEPEPSAEVYDPASDTWTLLASIPEASARTHQGVALIDNTVWHIGGRVGQNPGPLGSDIWIYNISTDSWSRGPEITDPATGQPLLWAAGGAVLLGRTLHIIGGFVQTACNNDQSTYHLTLDVDSWLADPSKPAKWENNLAPLPIKRNHFGTITLGGKIYAIGGQFGHDCGGGQDQRFSHVYDPATDTWTELPLLPTDRSHIEGGTFAMDGKIYVVAGQGNGGRSSDAVTVFDPAGNGGAGIWEDEPSLTLPRSYEGVSAKVIGNTFIISHGGEGSSYMGRRFTYTRYIDRNPVYKLGFSSGCLNLSAAAGTSVKGKTLLFTIDGSKNYTTSTNASWLTVSKNATGTAVPSAVDIELTANTTGLAPGNYNATVTATGAGDGPEYTETTYCVNLTVTGTAPSTTDTLQAEEATIYGGVVASNHVNYAGTGFVDYQQPYDDFIEWSVNRSEAGSVLLQFRYSNGRENDRPLKLEVNGVDVGTNISFLSTNSWTDWRIAEATVNLNAGMNTIKLTAVGSSGPNIDYVAISNNNTQEAKRSADKNLVQTNNVLKAFITPNPVSENAKLILTTSSKLPVEMELMDMLGKTYQKRKFVNNGSNSFDFSVKGLQTGMYIIKVKQGNNYNSTKLIIKN